MLSRILLISLWYKLSSRGHRSSRTVGRFHPFRSWPSACCSSSALWPSGGWARVVNSARRDWCWWTWRRSRTPVRFLRTTLRPSVCPKCCCPLHGPVRQRARGGGGAWVCCCKCQEWNGTGWNSPPCEYFRFLLRGWVVVLIFFPCGHNSTQQTS